MGASAEALCRMNHAYATSSRLTPPSGKGPLTLNIANTYGINTDA